MAKLKTTYRIPYFYPTKGDLISPEQIELMSRPMWIDGELSYDRSWRAVQVTGGRLSIDMDDLDGGRNDWVVVKGADGKWHYGRFLCVPTFANGKKFWLVTHTSY